MLIAALNMIISYDEFPADVCWDLRLNEDYDFAYFKLVMLVSILKINYLLDKMYLIL